MNGEGRLGPICGRDFGVEEARVVCRQLGRHATVGFVTPEDYSSAHNFAMEEVACEGRETKVQVLEDATLMVACIVLVVLVAFFPSLFHF